MRWSRWAKPGRSPRVRGSPVGGHAGAKADGSIPACAGEPGGLGGCETADGVDPRVCGGANCWLWLGSSMQGRSPRVRGSRPLFPDRSFPSGSIPACAGEPACRLPAGSRPTVDPRVCGGAGVGWGPEVKVWGRSPRVRGSRECHYHAPAPLGSIPACAGEPRSPGRGRCWSTVDPRVCGGAWVRASSRSRRAGRSPRVRGSRRMSLTEILYSRSIPACAGEPRPR